MLIHRKIKLGQCIWTRKDQVEVGMVTSTSKGKARSRFLSCDLQMVVQLQGHEEGAIGAVTL